MKKIIFLDLDGVMDTIHYNNWLIWQGLPETDSYGVLFDPECIENLEAIVNLSGAEIVVTSSWKNWMSYGQMLTMWNDRRLPGFLLDITPTCSNHRGDEIDRWLDIFLELSGNDEYEYVIIDDMTPDNFNETQLCHLVQVDSYHGLDKDATEKAIKILTGGSIQKSIIE